MSSTTDYRAPRPASNHPRDVWAWILLLNARPRRADNLRYPTNPVETSNA
jgi:hypothetical protein